MMDKELLEKEAEQSGKTIMHSLFKTLGSLPIKDVSANQLSGHKV
ncbi:hypothetical protein [Lonsdalea populi]|nr:hypothetical protein [Lonsdalea populi]